jgi:hypothetical protein
MRLFLGPRMKVIGDRHEVEAGFLGMSRLLD